MSNYCHFVGFDKCKFSEPVEFKGKKWVSVNYFLCDNDDPNFCIIKDVPKGYRLPTKEEFEELVDEYPFFVKKDKDVIVGGYNTTTVWNRYGNKKERYELPVYTFRNELGLEVSVYNYDDNWSGFNYGPICLTKEGFEDDLKEYHKPEKDKNGKSLFNVFKWRGKDRCSWVSEKCFDIATKKYYQHFDYRVPRCMILIKEDYVRVLQVRRKKSNS